MENKQNCKVDPSSERKLYVPPVIEGEEELEGVALACSPAGNTDKGTCAPLPPNT
jgi:hypothetical protein